MPIITPSPTLKTNTAALWLAALEAGAGNATLELYTGSKPGDTTVAPNGTTQRLLGTMTCSPTVGVAAAGELTFNPITQDSAADDNGTATWGRFRDGDGVAVIDVDAGVIGSTAFLQLNTTNIIAGGPIAVTSCVIRF